MGWILKKIILPFCPTHVAIHWESENIVVMKLFRGKIYQMNQIYFDKKDVKTILKLP